MLNVKIGDLPESLNMYEVIENGYSEKLRFIWSRVTDGMSVLVRCEKQIIPYLQQIIRKKLVADGKTVAIIDGRSDSSTDLQSTRIMNIVSHLRQMLNDTQSNKVFMLPYLDIITSVSHGGLSMEAKEIMTIIHENPFLVLVAFEDPEFPVPELISQAFPAKTELIGIDRNKLCHLITTTEAKKFFRKEVRLIEIYKYVSGLNPIRLREIMQIFAKKPDYTPSDPNMLRTYYRELREYTATSGADLSDIDLDKDIAGYGEVKKKIKNNILQLLAKTQSSDSEEYVKQIENLVPKGLIFYGPPGTGKTLFAKGIAHAINGTVHIVNGPELKSKWVGEGEANVRRLFARARATAPSVIVFDEIDSIASARSLSAGDGGAQANHSMVNQLLTEMDGFRKEELVFVIGTTNFPESLDQAFLRPGRFEYQIEIPYPKWEDRIEILSLYNTKLDIHLSKKDIENLASWTGRLTDSLTPHSGDHLNALMRNLKRHMINNDLDKISSSQLTEWLKSQVKSHKLEEHEEKVIAVHEVGHAVLFKKFERTEQIKRVTIDSDLTNILGMVEFKPKRNNMYTQNQLRQEIAISLGGYAAEKMKFGEYSTGACQDLKIATSIAESMVTVHGMGNLNIPRTYLDESGRLNPYYYNIVSPQVDAILLEVLEEVNTYLLQNVALLDKICEVLLQKRTIEAKELQKLFGESK